MSTELKAGDTITAESLNGIAEGAYTFKSGEILTASKLNTISEAIEDKDEEIAELQAQVEELQDEIDAFPTIESLSVTQNGTYSESGKAYSPVTVNVASGSKVVTLRSAVRHINNRNSDVTVPRFTTTSSLRTSTVPVNDHGFDLQEEIPLLESVTPGTYIFTFDFADSIAIRGTAPSGFSIAAKSIMYTGDLTTVNCDINLTFN